ncbi:ylmG homolog protein 2, chloroplastic [Phalaenopsis equestris]|uniref:ylmG homolog protein 2, chloroplastic n=1 Tax=Phalaenopsis equestris TaxID=78828 RepID=UPI0009E470D1|nr:ylmG homolog protein 2, chloroplastic [Phalaenopsis equestris]
MAPLPTDSPQAGLVSSSFRLHSKPPLLDRPPAAVARLLETLEAAVTSAADHPWLKPLLSISTEIRTFFAEVRCGNRGSRSSLSVHKFAAILPGDSVAGILVANGISNFLNIYNTLLVVRLVLTWFPNSPPAIVSPLSTICDPYLNIFRGIIPPLGGTLDLSPILAFIVLNAFTSTAAALPAEHPVSTVCQTCTSPLPFLQNLTSAQEKWIRRMCGRRNRTEE